MVTTRAKFKKIQNNSTTLVCSNDDLLTEILVRLPAKSILRFKSVSKHWQSLLSNRHFTLMFDKLSTSPGLFYRHLYIPFKDENQRTNPFHSLDFYPDPSGIKIVQSCNGLLLCCSNNVSGRKYYVFNPTTKQFKVIPPIRGGWGICTKFRFMGLAFHQKNFVHYKVVSFYRPNSVPVPDPDNKVLYHVQIYSSDTGKWRSLHQFSPVSIHMEFYEYGVYWNGAIHWAIGCNIFYFNLQLEQFQNLALPDYNENYHENGTIRPYVTPLYFGESQGHMHLVQATDSENRLHLNVYEVLSDHSRLFLKYHVELDELPVAYPEMIFSYLNQPIPHYEFKILDVVRGVKEEDTFMVLRIPARIMKYNILVKSFKPILNLCERIPNWTKGHRYIESIGSFYL